MINLTTQKVKDDSYSQEPIEDLLNIQKALFNERNIFCTLDECGNIWQNFSSSLAASWLFLPDLKDIVMYIESSDHFESYNEWVKI